MAMPEGIDNVMFLIVMRKHILQRGYDVPQSPDRSIEALVSTIAQVWVKFQNPYPPGLNSYEASHFGCPIWTHTTHHMLGVPWSVFSGDNTSIGIPQVNS